jgi:hypothetical protein
MLTQHVNKTFPVVLQLEHYKQESTSSTECSLFGNSTWRDQGLKRSGGCNVAAMGIIAGAQPCSARRQQLVPAHT